MLLEKSSTRVYNGILESTGNTPLIQLNKLIPGNRFHIFGKLEAVNPSGSIKDRTAGLILKRAMDSGRIKKGHTIVESSSGNMALGLAQACLYYGLHLIVVVDPNLNGHTEKILRAYGARIECVGRTEGSESYLSARLARVKELLEEIPGSYWTNQYGNPENPLAHQVTMKEIHDALDSNLDYLFIATSTCGTLMGCADYISQNGLDTKLIAVDAVGSVLFGGKPKKRLIPGHGAGVPSQFLDTSKIYDHVEISDRQCVQGCWRLLRNEGILCGGSTGGVVQAIIDYTGDIPDHANCAIILCDRGERYLDTIYNEEWISKNFSGIEKELEMGHH